MKFDYAALKAQVECLTEDRDDQVVLRVHRALSWLKRAELC
ncbi:MAG: hypothetical protein OXI11_10555 [Gammaproteobacteria bacterium]|nr:hypothetical protein [Gammaproteobacteria bacterium]